MEAGFARADISPPMGFPLMGYGSPWSRPCEGVHDPLFVRALWVSHGGRDAVIFGMDLCFIGREESDRFKGVLGRELGLLPEQILFNATHSHAAPHTGTYLDGEVMPPGRAYLREMEHAIVRAAREARDNRKTAKARAGMFKTKIPMNRRCLRDGKIINAPNPGGPVYDAMPVALFEDAAGKPICVAFAASTHVVCMRGREASADYPGVASDLIDAALGSTCALFLQGVGGDSRPALLSKGDAWDWQSGWAQAEAIGKVLGAEVLAALKGTLAVIDKFDLRTGLVDSKWPLMNDISREEYAKRGGDLSAPAQGLYDAWARRAVAMIDRGTLPTAQPILIQGIRLAPNLRFIAIEGEPLHIHGIAMEKNFPASGGATFALGYANGEGMYLPSTEMLAQGGYEPESFWEYNVPSALAPGLEKPRDAAFEELKKRGV